MQVSKLAPLHNPVSMKAIREAMKVLGSDMRHVAIFDTAFHKTLSPSSYTYAIPTHYLDEDHVRRYGFHGTSHRYLSKQAAAFLKKNISETRIISLHLGNGSSVCAIDGGRSIDTSMGFTPLEGTLFLHLGTDL